MTMQPGRPDRIVDSRDSCSSRMLAIPVEFSSVDNNPMNFSVNSRRTTNDVASEVSMGDGYSSLVEINRFKRESIIPRLFGSIRRIDLLVQDWLRLQFTSRVRSLN